MSAARAAALLVVAACRTGSAGEPPAYVPRPTPESRASLANAVSTALGGTHVDLDDDALTTSGVLIVEHNQRRDAQMGAAIDGRDPSAPAGISERFHLVKLGEQCVLVHDRTDRHYPLAGTACEPR